MLAQAPLANTIQGEVIADNQPTVASLVSIELTKQGRPVASAILRADGSFEIRDAPPGDYELQVLDSFKNVVRREFIVVSDQHTWVTVRIPSKSDLPKPAGAVSIRQLAPPPPKARKEFALAAKALERGNLEESIRRLENAVRIWPEFIEAHNNLGVRFMQRGEYERAAAAFRQALTLDPHSVLPRANLALLLVRMRRFAEAEQEAAAALQRDPSSVQAHYAFGLARAAQGDCAQEAIRHLQIAVASYPHARLGVAQVLACQGRILDAIEQLRSYLASDTVEHRFQVQAWLKQLELKQ